MKEYDLIVIGGGPGGYVAAIRAAQLGFNVACVEKEPQLGGTCLRVGCIPSKVLLESSEHFHAAKTRLPAHGIRFGDVQFDLAAMMARKNQIISGLSKGVEALLKKNKVTRHQGTARITAPGRVTVENGGETGELSALRIIIATGSRPAELPEAPVDGQVIGTSTEALSYDRVPEHLAVIGASYIGLELGSVWRRLGAKVTFVEFLDRIMPGMDREIADDAKRVFERQGFEFRLGHCVAQTHVRNDRCTLDFAGHPPLECDRVLVAVGRTPRLDGLGIETLGIRLTPKGRIAVNEHFETSVPGIFAIGDVIPGPMLAHKAEEEGMACAEYLATGKSHVLYDAIPGVAYTHPEIASVGKTEEQLRENGTAYRKGVFPFRSNGRAHTLGETEGKVKVLADAATDRLLGVHLIGPRAGDLIAEAAAALALNARAEDIFRCPHAHPTLAEAFKEAALAVHGRPIHM